MSLENPSTSGGQNLYPKNKVSPEVQLFAMELKVPQFYIGGQYFIKEGIPGFVVAVVCLVYFSFKNSKAML